MWWLVMYMGGVCIICGGWSCTWVVSASDVVAGHVHGGCLYQMWWLIMYMGGVCIRCGGWSCTWVVSVSDVVADHAHWWCLYQMWWLVVYMGGVCIRCGGWSCAWGESASDVVAEHVCVGMASVRSFSLFLFGEASHRCSAEDGLTSSGCTAVVPQLMNWFHLQSHSV
jgi:hypothetical protein